MSHAKLVKSNLMAILAEIQRIKTTGTEFTIQKDLDNLIEISERNVNRCISLIEKSEPDLQ